MKLHRTTPFRKGVFALGLSGSLVALPLSMSVDGQSVGDGPAAEIESEAPAQEAQDSTSPTKVSSNATPEPSQRGISDWALAGVVWSDANLVRKLSTDILKTDLPDQKRESLRDVASQAQQVIDRMEQFGWNRLRDGKNELSDTVAQRTAAGESRGAAAGDVSELKQFDTETPAGRQSKVPPQETSANARSRREPPRCRYAAIRFMMPMISIRMSISASTHHPEENSTTGTASVVPVKTITFEAVIRRESSMAKTN